MDSRKPNRTQDPQTSLNAGFRMGCLLLLLWAIHLLEAWITFPFVDHQNNRQNLVYALVVTAPYLLTLITYLVLTRRDLARLNPRIRRNPGRDI